jgi:ABC-type phosphate transport system auxiliary subunit
VAAVSADVAERTMYEHVQMLANLYRRAGQVEAARAALIRHYTHRLAQARHPQMVAGSLSDRQQSHPGVHQQQVVRTDQRIDELLARLRSAQTESELIAAVNAIDDAR